MSDPEPLLVEKVKDLVGGYLARLPGGHYSADQIAAQLAGEISAGLRKDPHGTMYAPDQFTLSIHPDDAEALIGSASINQEELSKRLKGALTETGYRLAREPHITLATDPTLQQWEVRTIAWHSSDPLRYSAVTADLRSKPLDQAPAGAFLIIQGKRNFPLDRPLIDIGRRLDNHLLLEDPHVSRKHAQLKARDGRFILADLDSTSGTRVNGKPIKEHMLRPGDVITIAGIEMIYGEDVGGPPEEVPPYQPPVEDKGDRDRITPLDLKTLRNLPRPKGRREKESKSERDADKAVPTGGAEGSPEK